MRKWQYGWIIAGMVLACPIVVVGASAQVTPDTATALTLGKVARAEIETGETQDFRADLPAGTYTVYVDAKAHTKRAHGSLTMLKKNGAALPGFNGELLNWIESWSWRAGKTFTLKANTAVRFRLKADDGQASYGITLVSANQKGFVPFAFGAEVKEAKVGTDEGVGGSLKEGECAFYRATIPAGKWDISVAAKLPDGRAYAECYFLSEKGIYEIGSALAEHLIIAADDSGGQKRQEKTITLVKPKTLLFRIVNEMGTESPMTYDLTIQKAGD
jgi:hypothetical protein